MQAIPNWKQAVADGIDPLAQAARYAALAEKCDAGCDSLGIAASIICRISCLDFLKLENWYLKHADELKEAMGGPGKGLPKGYGHVDEAYMRAYRKWGFEQYSNAEVQAALDALLKAQHDQGWNGDRAAQIQALIDIIKGQPCKPHGVPPDPAGNHGPAKPEEPET